MRRYDLLKVIRMTLEAQALFFFPQGCTLVIHS